MTGGLLTFFPFHSIFAIPFTVDRELFELADARGQGEGRRCGFRHRMPPVTR